LIIHSTLLLLFLLFPPVNSNDGQRRRREQTTLEIRRQKKDQELQLKRLPLQEIDQNNDNFPVSLIQLEVKSNKTTLDDIPRLTEIISGEYARNDKTEATRKIRSLISKEGHPPIVKVIQSGALPYLVSNLTVDPQNQSLIFESAWALTNIASLDYGSDLAIAGAIPPLVKLIADDFPLMREQAMWCLGNIAGEGIETRDAVLAHNPIPNL
jgi:hypothetical protein